MNLARVAVIARTVFLEVIRDRILYLVALFALLMVVATLLLPQVSAGAEDKIILDLGLAAINLLSVVVAIFVGTSLVNKEIEKRTVLVLITKPISRLELIVGKHLGLVAMLAVLISLLTLILLVLLSLSGIAYPLASLLLAAGFMLLEVALLTAVALLFGVFTSSLLATLLTFAVYLVGHLSQDILSLGQLSQNPGLQRLTQVMYLVLPDLARLNLKNQAVYGFELIPTGLELGSHMLYALLYTGLLLAIATGILSRRQF